eukprot:gene11736-15702_t
MVDIICVFNPNSQLYCCQSYKIKLKVPSQSNSTNHPITKVSHNNGNGNDSTKKEDLNTGLTIEIPNEELNQFQAHTLISSAQFDEHNRVDVICNSIYCDTINAMTGSDNLVYFVDPIDSTFSLVLTNIILQQFNLQHKRDDITDGRVNQEHMSICNQIVFRHRQSGAIRELNLWVYNVDDRMVVVDIDGTITKSDVTGYIQTVYFGIFTHIHLGVVDFFQLLTEKYNCNIIYLTARPKIVRNETKQFLHNLSSYDNRKLPNGPLFMNDEELAYAVYRELIAKTTMEFKSIVLGSLTEVFQNAGLLQVSPFIFGFGNKESDANAYNLSGINTESIFIIDTSSKIKVWKYLQIYKDPLIAESYKHSGVDVINGKLSITVTTKSIDHSNSLLTEDVIFTPNNSIHYEVEFDSYADRSLTNYIDLLYNRLQGNS